MYKHANNKTMTSGAIAAMLSTILYGRRFFPYYVYNIIGGLDEEGIAYWEKSKKDWAILLLFVQQLMHFYLFFGLSL